MKKLIAAVFLSGLAVSLAQASVVSFSFTGSFRADDESQFFYLTVPVASTITFETLSYGGGLNAAGSTILNGGFDPRLTWYQDDGTQIGADNGGHCGSTASYLGACNDAFFTGFFGAGNYYLALTQDPNTANGDIIDGFAETGNGNFTASGGCTGFCDSLSGTQLNGHWAVDILNVSSAIQVGAVPEPMTFAMGGSALGLLWFTKRRRTRSAA